MNNIATFIVKYRKILMLVFIALMVYSITLIPQVNIDYNLINYLPDGETSKGIEVMSNEFGSMDQVRIYLRDTTKDEAKAFAEEVALIEGVQRVIFEGNADFVDNSAIISVLTGHETLSSQEILEKIEKLVDKENGYVLGTTKMSNNLRNAIAEQMPIILLIAFVIIFVVLFITSDSYLEPILFAVVIGISIVINLGTNAWLPKVSFITHAICAIMQLAMAMDYAIMLLHRFREEENKTTDVVEAMVQAVKFSISTITSSSLTTIAGLAAIMLMQFKLGYDLGMVLIKGIIWSMLTVFLFMPGLLLMLNKVLHKTAHKHLIPSISALNGFIYKSRKVLPFVLVVVIAFGVFGASLLQYNYAVSDLGASCNEEYMKVDKEVNEKFGKSNIFVLLLPVGDEQKEIAVADYLLSLDSEERPVSSVLGMGATPVYKSMTADEFAYEIGVPRVICRTVYKYLGYEPTDSIQGKELVEKLYEHENDVGIAVFKDAIESIYGEYKEGLRLLVSNNYTRVLVMFNMATDTEKAFETVSILREGIKEYYDEFYLFGDTVNMYDIRESFASDMVLTNAVTIGAILIILLIIFKRIPVSVLLIAIIQGAIQINSAITAVSGNTMFFCCKMFVDCIVMGATVDYAILLTTRFTEARKLGKNNKESLFFAMDATMITVLASGVILVLAGFTIGWVSTVSVVSEIGLLVGRGALISIILIVCLLPQCLIIIDNIKGKWKNRKGRKKENNNSQLIAKKVDKGE